MRGMVELISVINRMHISLGKSMIDNILQEEIEIAKKLRAHIKNYDIKKHFN
jgi:hypothetical protein